MKKMLIAMLAVTMMFSMTACGGSSAPAPAPAESKAEENAEGAAEGAAASSKDTIIFAQMELPTTMDPYADTNTGTNACLELVYDTLWNMEEDGTYTPRLATEWEWVDDLHLAVTLREGVTFSNGNAFTADDVLYTLEYAQNAPISSNFVKIDLANTVVEDDTHITIAFTDIDPTYMIYAGSVGAGCIMDRETCEADAMAISTNSVGTGRYTMTNFTTGDSMTFAKNEGYWGEDAAIIPNVIMRQITEATQRAIELQSGGVDYILSVDPLDLDTLNADPNFEAVSEASLMVHKLFFNQERACGDENVRKAIAYAINNQDLVDAVFSGVGTVANSTVSPAAAGFADELAGGLMYEQDFEKAKECLAEAGYADGLSLRAIAIEGSFVKEFEIIKNELAQVGIDLTIDTYDFTTALTYALDKSTDWDLYMLANNATTATVQLSWYDRNQGAPFAVIPDDGLFELLDELYVTTDADKQVELAAQAQVYQMEHVLVYPLVIDNKNVGFAANLKNVKADADQMPDMSKVYFE